jgi:hypothetical protein
MSSEKELKDSSTTEKEQAKKQAERIATLADNKDVRKEAAKVADKLENVIEEEERKTRIPTSTSVLQQQQDEVIKSLDRTKDIIKTLAKESKREITRYTQIVNDYQDQAIEAARVIAENQIESQKEIINLCQSPWLPYVENTNGLFWNNWMIPGRITETYANMVSGFANVTIATTRLVNNMIFANMDAFKAAMEQAKDNSKELLRTGTNNTARMFDQTAIDTKTF